jgi:hypothetical protein
MQRETLNAQENLLEEVQDLFKEETVLAVQAGM